MVKKIFFVVLALAVVGAGYWYWHTSNNSSTSFRTTQAERGKLVVTISATGTLEPEEVVDVGAQIAGQILSFGQDVRDKNRFVDYGAPVEIGTVLARIDPSLFQSQVESGQAMLEQAKGQVASAEAQVQQAEANQKRSEADLLQLQAKLWQADRDFDRTKTLDKSSRGAVSQSDLDTAEAAFRTASANVAVGQAAIEQAKASLVDAKANAVKAKATLGDAQASLARAEINLSYCTIKSPVKGVIIDRRVNIGQTVVSSLNSPSLFLIAKDLRRMQVWASVNEADIAHIHSGQGVHFTVDAFSGETFRGTVAPDQPRLNASMTQNVVTFTVVVNTDNTSGKLLPFLTANLDFEVDQRENALMVPNAALRWRPQPAQIVPDAREAANVKASAKRATAKSEGEKKTEKTEEHGTVYKEENGLVRPVHVKLGISDGVHTEIVSGELKEGDALVVGETRRDADAANGGANPFTPRMFNAKKQQ
jgi:HlyD family secretion protein